MFEYFNVPATDDVVRSGKEIRFSQKQELPKYQDSYLAQEWLYLKEKYGFDEVILKGDVWIGE